MALTFKRSFHYSVSPGGPNPFFHLQALSNARETARASRLSKLPRTVHSPQLQLLEAEASVAPLASSSSSVPSDRPQAAVKTAGAPSSPTPTTPQALPPSKPIASQTIHNQAHPEVLKEIRDIRQEFGQCKASIDHRLALITRQLKDISSKQSRNVFLSVLSLTCLNLIILLAMAPYETRHEEPHFGSSQGEARLNTSQTKLENPIADQLKSEGNHATSDQVVLETPPTSPEIGFLSRWFSRLW